MPPRCGPWSAWRRCIRPAPPSSTILTCKGPDSPPAATRRRLPRPQPRAPRPPAARRRSPAPQPRRCRSPRRLPGDVLIIEVQAHPGIGRQRRRVAGVVQPDGLSSGPGRLEPWQDNHGADPLPALSLPPGGFAVVAADEAVFRALFPGFSGSAGHHRRRHHRQRPGRRWRPPDSARRGRDDHRRPVLRDRRQRLRPRGAGGGRRALAGAPAARAWTRTPPPTSWTTAAPRPASRCRSPTATVTATRYAHRDSEPHAHRDRQRHPHAFAHGHLAAGRRASQRVPARAA